MRMLIHFSYLNRKAYMHRLHIVSNVSKMSESEKRTPISVYLTPKAAMILRNYNMGSGYGSLSRTVEEIILAFDAVYKSMGTFKQWSQATMSKRLSNEQKASYFVMLLSVLMSIDNAITRLQSGRSPSPQV